MNKSTLLSRINELESRVSGRLLNVSKGRTLTQIEKCGHMTADVRYIEGMVIQLDHIRGIIRSFPKDKSGLDLKNRLLTHCQRVRGGLKASMLTADTLKAAFQQGRHDLCTDVLTQLNKEA